MSVVSPQPEPVASEPVLMGQPSVPEASAVPRRPSRQDLVVPQRGSGPWMAVAVVGCGLLGFATAFVLEIGRSHVGESGGELANTPVLLEPAAAAPVPETSTPGSRFGGGQLTAAVEPELSRDAFGTQTFGLPASGTDLPPLGESEEADRATPPATQHDHQEPHSDHEATSRYGPQRQTYAMVTARKPPVDVEPLASADLPPLDKSPENPAAETGPGAGDPAPADAADDLDLPASGTFREEPPLPSESTPEAEPPAGSAFGSGVPGGGVAEPNFENPAQGSFFGTTDVAAAAEPTAPLPDEAFADQPSLAADDMLREEAGDQALNPATSDASDDLEPQQSFALDAPAAADSESEGFRVMADVQPGYATPVGQNDPVTQPAAPSLSFDDPDAPVAVTPPSAASAAAPSTSQGFPAPAASLDTPQTQPANSARYASSDAIRAFGGNLPERPMLPNAQQTALPTPEPPQASAFSRGFPAADAAVVPGASGASPAFPGEGPGYGVTGIGRPGPALLEGVQAPQVAVEKRGPREVQVGKFARYEILVRNVSSVTAHDVELLDMVPEGTSLVSTTPPAAPGIDGQLTWQLGSMDPGEQARVLVEVLPNDEGEIGSVASVRFSAKASVRSLATRPALSLAIEQPSPMRIGGEVPVVITVSNPGTGRATGVVLEGVLPEGLAHRAGRELEFDIGSLKPGESRSIDLLLATTGPGMHRIDVGVRADGQLEERQNVAVEVTAPTLELTAELPSRRYLQRPVTCVLSMANAGTAAARSVELAVQLPPGLKFVTANNAGYYDEKNHRVLWQLEELPPAEIGSVEMVLMPIAMGSQQVMAAARSPDGLADQITRVLEVEGVAALTFSVVDSEDPIEVDGLTEYVIRVGNQGTKPASNVRVTATMLGDLQPVDADGPVEHQVENLTVSFDPLARLAPTEEAVFRVQARGRREGDQRVQVQVTEAEQQTPVTKEEVTRVYADR